MADGLLGELGGGPVLNEPLIGHHLAPLNPNMLTGVEDDDSRVNDAGRAGPDSPVIVKEPNSSHASEDRGAGKQARIATPGAWRQNLTRDEGAAITAILERRLRAHGYQA